MESSSLSCSSQCLKGCKGKKVYMSLHVNIHFLKGHFVTFQMPLSHKAKNIGVTLHPFTNVVQQSTATGNGKWLTAPLTSVSASVYVGLGVYQELASHWLSHVSCGHQCLNSLPTECHKPCTLHTYRRFIPLAFTLVLTWKSLQLLSTSWNLSTTGNWAPNAFWERLLVECALVDASVLQVGNCC